ncbi:MAG: T9SS type A sorting domain-containing protein [Ignavibacteriales bacterium]|nr:T9SS type A sorting domain-containing protein [Ignavibacteriales bacterium]
MQSGDHRILSPGFPFYSMPFDSTFITRYSAVDSSGSYSFVIDKGRMKYTYTFKEGIGATSYSAMDMCICLDYWNASYGLINYQINAVETNREMNNITEFKLEQNYPNPFNPITTINYKLPVDDRVMLKVYDILGREVAILVNENKKRGSYEVEFDGSMQTSGVYFYTLQAGNYIGTKKLLLMK